MRRYPHVSSARTPPSTHYIPKEEELKNSNYPKPLDCRAMKLKRHSPMEKSLKVGVDTLDAPLSNSSTGFFSAFTRARF